MIGPRGDMSPDFGGLGKKVERSPADEQEEWVQYGDNPHIQRNTKTDRLRNIKPPPYAEQWGWVCIPIADAAEITPAAFRQMLKDAEIAAGAEVQVGMAFSPDGLAWLLQPKDA